MDTTAAPLLDIRDLSVAFTQGTRELLAVDRVSFDIRRGETVALVGESGSGKSVTALSVMKLLPYPAARHPSGTITFKSMELLGAPEAKMRKVRGNDITIIFQEPMTSLNPAYTVGDQIVEAIQQHQHLSAADARARAIEMLRIVRIPSPERRVDDYPHKLSGGMRQRAMIAMALACGPDLLIADEPTTALDVTIQAQILALLERLNRERGLATILITHDLGVVAEVADRVAVMYAGRIVEEGTLDEIFYDPQHPYTWGLLGSLTRIDRPRPKRLPQIPGAPPSLLDLDAGCAFRERCPHAHERCAEMPELEARLEGNAAHRDRCWLEPARKLELREVEGRIGLESPALARWP